MKLAETSKKHDAAVEEDIFSVAVINYKIIAWALILVNLLVITIVVFADRTSTHFASNIPAYTLLIILYLTSLITTIFSLKNSNYFLLYPILVATICFVIAPLSLCMIFLIKASYCSATKSTKIHLSFFRCDALTTITVKHYLLFLVVSAEKLFELFIFYRLLKLFKHYRENLESRTVKVKNTFTLDEDTDDEIIVFKKVVDDGGLQKINDYGAAKPAID